MRLLSHFACSALVATVLFPLAAAQTAAPFQFVFTDRLGPWSVGLRVIDQYDASRPFTLRVDGATISSPHGRPLQTLVWYPAQRSHQTPMTVGDYAALIETETSFDHPVDNGSPQKFVAAFTQGTGSIRMWAIRDAKVHRGRFPIVIYAPSVDAPSTENIDLCEYLASHGYIVLATPSMGASSRKMTVNLAGANAQSRDISFLITSAEKLTGANSSAVAVIGYSWGGMGALFASASDPRIHSLISFDGSFYYDPGTVSAAGVHPNRITVPLLFFSRAPETANSPGRQRTNGDSSNSAPNVLSQWIHGDLLHLEMLAMSHIEFCSLFLRSQRFRTDGFHFDPVGYSPQQGANSYNWTVRYTLAFLDAYLKHRPAAVAFLRRPSTENGVPPHLIDSTFSAATDATLAHH